MSEIKTMSGQDQGPDTRLGAHGDLTAAYKSSYARHSTPSGSGNDTAYGRGVGSPDSDTAFSTGDADAGSGLGESDAGDTPSDSSGYGKGIAGELPMVTRGEGADNGQHFGKAI